jgi:Ca2+-binding RTX toxin-like protein
MHIYTGWSSDDLLRADALADAATNAPFSRVKKVLVYGNGGDDTIIFSAIDDTIYGGTGNDTIKLGFGNDRASGGAGNDTILIGYGTHTADGGSGNDTIESTANIDFARNPPKTASGSIGSNGNDVLAGGSGTDTLSYAKGQAIIADLSKHTVKGFTTDRVTGFEHLIGSRQGDTITGSKRAETLDGAGGNDVIRSLGGADTLTGGSGRDVFVFSKKDVGASNGVDRITDFALAKGDKLDVRDFFKGHGGESVADMLRVRDSDAGTFVSLKADGGFVSVVLLEDVHGISAQTLYAKGLLVA